MRDNWVCAHVQKNKLYQVIIDYLGARRVDI